MHSWPADIKQYLVIFAWTTDCRAARSGDFTSKWLHKIQVGRMQLDILEKKLFRLFFRIFMEMKTQQDLGNHLNVKEPLIFSVWSCKPHVMNSFERCEQSLCQ